MHLDDATHRVLVRETDVVEEAAAQECVRQLLLVVAGDDDDRAVPRLDELARLIDVKLHPIEFAQQVVRELDVCLVDLVDEQNGLNLRLEGLPQLAPHDVVADIGNARITQLRISQTRYGVVLIKSLLRLAGRLDVPLEERPAECSGDFDCQLRLARSRLAFNEQRTRERHGGVDGHAEITRGDVSLGAFETTLALALDHGHSPDAAAALRTSVCTVGPGSSGRARPVTQSS